MGARKTATTYIQHALGRSEAALAASGLYLPAQGRFDLNPGNISHHNLGFELRNETRFRPEAGGWDELGAELADVRPRTALLSCELFEALATEDDRSAELVERFLPLGDEITVVLIVRRWDEFVNSLYNQCIKMFSKNMPIDHFVRDMLAGGHTRWAERLHPFIDHPDIEFVVLTYDQLKRGTDPLSGPLEAARVDHDPSKLVVPDRLINTSLGAIGLEVTRVLGKYLGGTYDDWEWNARAEQELHIKNLVRLDQRGWNREAYWGWTAAMYDELMPVVERDMNDFAQAVWGTDWPGSQRSRKEPTLSRFGDFPAPLLANSLDHIHEMRGAYDAFREQLR